MSPTAAIPQAGVFNWANGLTVARIVMGPFLFWAILAAEDTRGTSWAAVALGWALAATDYYDGILARRGRVSRWGAFLDPLADKFVVLGGMACLVAVRRYWWVPVAVIAAREVAMTLFRTYWARRGLSVPARRSAKYKTLVQGLAMFVAVLPPLENADAVVAGVLWVAVAITVLTGWQYFHDGRTATSRSGALAST